jgi:hypothetical protein
MPHPFAFPHKSPLLMNNTSKHNNLQHTMSSPPSKPRQPHRLHATITDLKGCLIHAHQSTPLLRRTASGHLFQVPDQSLKSSKPVNRVYAPRDNGLEHSVEPRALNVEQVRYIGRFETRHGEWGDRCENEIQSWRDGTFEKEHLETKDRQGHEEKGKNGNEDDDDVWLQVARECESDRS